MKAVIHSDGGSRGNPGPAAIGVVVKIDGKKIEIGETIGIATNNVAEYVAIVRGLKESYGHGATEAECFADSELIVRQLRGEYRIKDEKMKQLAQEAFTLRAKFKSVTFTEIPREKNKEADKLVNNALDAVKNAQKTATK